VKISPQYYLVLDLLADNFSKGVSTIEMAKQYGDGKIKWAEAKVSRMMSRGLIYRKERGRYLPTTLGLLYLISAKRKAGVK
jgi:hypothetical protein